MGKVHDDEAPAKCCLCIPIACGVLFIGIGILEAAAAGVLNALNLWSDERVNAIISGVLVIPLVIATDYFVRYWRDRTNKAARAHLPVACVYAALS